MPNAVLDDIGLDEVLCGEYSVTWREAVEVFLQPASGDMEQKLRESAESAFGGAAENWEDALFMVASVFYAEEMKQLIGIESGAGDQDGGYSIIYYGWCSAMDLRMFYCGKKWRATPTCVLLRNNGP